MRTRTRRLFVAITLGAAVLLPAAAAQAGPATTSLASVNSTGVVGNHRSGQASISADGRFVAFWSEATNLDTAADTNGFSDVFLRDRKTGQTKRISVGSSGVQGNLYSYSPAISADGRYVYFLFDGTTLIPGSGGYRLYRYDRIAEALSLVPMPSEAADPEEDTPSVSSDGSRVVFTAFVAGPSKRVYMWNAATNQVTLVSAKANGAAPAGNTTSEYPSISADGRTVAFSTNATDLAPGTDTNGATKDVLVKNLDTGAVERASTTSAGQQGNALSDYPTLSADGCLVAFYSDVISLVAGQTTTHNVFVKHRCGSTDTEVASDGLTATAYFANISDDGCRVAFNVGSGASIRVHDRCAGGTSRVDVSTDGVAGNGAAGGSVFSGGSGRYIAFDSASTNFDGADTTGGTDGYDVYVRDLATNTAPAAALKTSVAGTQVTVDGSGSADPDGWVLNGTINYGDGTPLQSGLNGVHTYSQGGTYGVTLTVTDADGASATAFKAIVVADPPVGGSPSGTQAQSTAGAGSGLGGSQLILDRLSVSRSRFGVVPAGGKPDRRRGATLSLRLSAAATVTITFDRAKNGRRVKGRCRAGAGKGTRCTLYKRDGVLTKSLPAGTSDVKLTGVLGSKQLAAGIHRITVQATGADGRRTAAKVLTITIVKVK